MRTIIATCLVLASAATNAFDSSDIANKIRYEGFYRSEVMETLRGLTDEIGPRLSGSPQMKKANDWTKEKLESWGMKNAHLEPFEFGRGWSHDSVSVSMTSPRVKSLHAIPVAWTPGTNGVAAGEVVVFEAESEADLAQYQGKIRGKILLMGDGDPIGEPKNEVFKRHDSKALSKLKKFDVNAGPSHKPWVNTTNRDRFLHRYLFREKLNQFLKQEGVAAVVHRSWRQGGLIGVFGRDHRVGHSFSVPAVIVEAEQYNLLTRLVDEGVTPALSLEVKARFHDDDYNAYNTIAEIPGKGRNPELVLVGAHLDSWHASDGAVDNGAGVAVAMEAMRILKSLNVPFKRTIRVALWSGEEQGLFGSKAYVEKHLATRPKPKDKAERDLPSYLWQSPGWPIKPKSDYEKFSAYFNMDNGSGRFRGIYTEGNVAAGSVFSRWFQPYSDLSTGTITHRSTGGTDHEAFDNVGLPGFQFIQDPLDYGSRLHHTHIDSFDHVVEADLKQASVIMAGFLYEAAMSDKLIPRKPMPAAPTKLELKKMQLEAEKAMKEKMREANKAKAIEALKN